MASVASAESPGVPTANLPNLKRVLDLHRVIAEARPGIGLGHPIANLPALLRHFVGDDLEPQFQRSLISAGYPVSS
jgi:hypothetical protein